MGYMIAHTEGFLYLQDKTLECILILTMCKCTRGAFPEPPLAGSPCNSVPTAVLIGSSKHTASASQLPSMLPSGQARDKLLWHATVHLDFSKGLAHLLL